MTRVYDDRTDETLFEGINSECIMYINNNYDEDDDDYSHIWIDD